MKLTSLLLCVLLLAACSTTTVVVPTQVPATGGVTTDITETVSATASPTFTPTADLTATNTPAPTLTPTDEPGEAQVLDFNVVEEMDQPTIHDFSPIEGQWYGQAKEEGEYSFWMELSLSSGAERGSQVGRIRYFIVDGGIPICTGLWLVITANDPVYTVREDMNGRCPDGMVRLEHDPQTGTMSYDFTPTEGDPSTKATGTLSRVD